MATEKSLIQMAGSALPKNASNFWHWNWSNKQIGNVKKLKMADILSSSYYITA